MQALPSLRQELTLAESPTSADGSPVWTLYDPSAHRFYQLSWPAFEILSRWSLGDVAAIVSAVRRETTLRIDANDVLALIQFLITHQLTIATTATDTQRLLDVRQRQKVSSAMWLLKHYLFIRVPLFRPMSLLRIISPNLQWLFHRTFWRITIIAGIAGLYFASQQWEAFLHTFHQYAGWQGLLGIAIAISFAKVLHEFGHALTAYRYGCHVPTMGIALLVMWPVLYTDTNEAWKLRSRRERLHIGAAGMLAELALAAYATLLWNVLPDGPLRAGIFMLATSTWIITLTLNASPFTRFDGYFLLADWLNVPNLHERAFALTRWWLRKHLFGFNVAPPEVFAPSRQRFLIGFSLVAWLYRLVLFFSIALLVFHFFFHALGIVLMLVEIGWFILLPVMREIHVWWQRRAEMQWNKQSLRSALALVFILLMIFIPWNHSLSSPAVLSRMNAQGIYVARAAVVQDIAVREGQTVASGEVLVHLQSPELEHQLQDAIIQEASLRWQVEQQPFNDELNKTGKALRKHWEAARETVAGLRAQHEQLTVHAPFDGQIADLNLDLRAGIWLREGERLFSVIGKTGVKGEAFITETNIERIHPGAAVTFIGNLPESIEHRCKVLGIDQVNVGTFDSPYLASIYGGPIASHKAANGEVLPRDSLFRVRFDRCLPKNDLAQELGGWTLLQSDQESIFIRALRSLTAILRRELTA